MKRNKNKLSQILKYINTVENVTNAVSANINLIVKQNLINMLSTQNTALISPTVPTTPQNQISYKKILSPQIKNSLNLTNLPSQKNTLSPLSSPPNIALPKSNLLQTKKYNPNKINDSPAQSLASPFSISTRTTNSPNYINNNSHQNVIPTKNAKKLRETLSAPTHTSTTGYTISPNILVEMNGSKNSNNFNEIWNKIGERLKNEMSASAKGLHV